MLRPNAYLTFTLEGASITADNASAIKRGYSYVAPTKIVAGRREAVEGEAPLSNTIQLDVRLGAQPLWGETAGDANAIWDEVLLPWLALKLDKLFGTVRECNTETRPSFCGIIEYHTFDLVIDGMSIRFALEQNSLLRDAEKPLRAIRAWRNANMAAEIAHVAVPSNAERGDTDWFDVTFADGTVLRV